MVIHELERRNPEIKFGANVDMLDICQITDKAYELHWCDFIRAQAQQHLTHLHTQTGKQNEYVASEQELNDYVVKYPYSKHINTAKKLFYDLYSEGKDGTMSYLAKACLKIVPFDLHFSMSDVNVASVAKLHLSAA